MDSSALLDEHDHDVELEAHAPKEGEEHQGDDDAAATRWDLLLPLIPSLLLAGVAALLLGPVLPELKVQWFDNDFKRAQEISGMASSAKCLLSCLVSPFMGQLSDKFGRRPLIRLSNVGFFIPVLALYLTQGASAEAYFVTTILCGVLTAGQTFLFVAYVADCTSARDRPRMFGYLGAVSALTMIFTPLLEHTLLSHWSNLALFQLALFLLALNAMWIEIALPESRPVATSPDHLQQEQKQVNLSASQRHLLFWLSVYVFITALVESGIGEIGMIYLNDVLGVHPDGMRHFTSGYMSLMGVGMFVSQTVYIRLLAPKPWHTFDWMLAVACAANALHLLVYISLSFNHSVNVAYCNSIITSFMFVGGPATNALISKHANAGQQGYMLGALESVRSFVGAIGPVLFSFLYSHFGTKHDFPAAPYVFGASFLSIALFIVLCGPLLWRPMDEEEEEPIVSVS